MAPLNVGVKMVAPDMVNEIATNNNIVIRGTTFPSSWVKIKADDSKLAPPNQLTPGQSLISANGRYNLTLQADGNLVLYRGATPLWSTNTSGKPVTVAAMQADGNLVLYDAHGHPLWYSGTNGHPGAFLTVQDDGNVVLYVEAGPLRWPIWATNTVDPSLFPPEQLSPGQSITSRNGSYALTLQTDGNLVLYQGATPLWSTNTSGKPVTVAAMQADGNLVLYDAQKHPLWNSGTSGNPGAFLTVQDDGNVVLYVGAAAIWATNTRVDVVVLPPQLDFDTGYVSMSGPVGGSAHVTLHQDGSYQFHGSFHNASILPFDYSVALVITDSTKQVYTFGHQYSFGGGPSDDNFPYSGQNAAIAQNWPALAARATAIYSASVALDLGTLMNELLVLIGYAQKVWPIVAAL
jgi:hypothetical protein